MFLTIMLETPVCARVFYTALAAMLNIGAGGLGLGYAIAAIVLQPAVGLRIPDRAAVTV